MYGAFQIYRTSDIIRALKTPAFSHSFEVDFSETYLVTSAQKSVSEPPNLKLFLGRIPPDHPTRLVPSALMIMPAPRPRYKKT